ncbi:WSC domain-containing protein [Tricladium varicosporioides]|nr:WSC domain-containing protein [Hymenoscyphus varicosporioides]
MAFSTAFLTRVSFLIAFLCLLPACLAQSTSPTSTNFYPPSATSTSATVYPGTSAWSYYGCWNETTMINGTNGNRALDGNINAFDSMTVGKCLDICKNTGYTFAGLEYTRECYCSRYVSSLSTKLAETNCNLACEGNSSQICGGSLSLTVYQAKSSTKAAGIKGVREAPVGSILALGIAMGVLLCLA